MANLDLSELLKEVKSENDDRIAKYELIERDILISMKVLLE